MGKSKIITKDSNDFINRLSLMLGEFKSDQLFFEKIKLANNLHAEN